MSSFLSNVDPSSRRPSVNACRDYILGCCSFPPFLSPLLLYVKAYIRLWGHISATALKTARRHRIVNKMTFRWEITITCPKCPLQSDKVSLKSI
jgi:hypothetical protein